MATTRKNNKKPRNTPIPDALESAQGVKDELSACEKSLTHRQFILVYEYLTDMDFTSAMLRAGYKNVSNATRLKKTPKVQKAISLLLQERRDNNQWVVNKMLAILVQVVDLSVDDFLVWEGTTIRLKPMADVPPEKRALLVEWKQTGGGGFSIKLPDKIAAIEMLMRHLGMFEKPSRRSMPPKGIRRSHPAV